MASSYQTYQGAVGYDPERTKVDRSRRLAEMLQEGALDTGPKSMWEGVAQLGKAFIARGAMDRADKAESAYGDSQKQKYAQLAQTLSGTLPGDSPAISSGAKTTFGDTGEATITPGAMVTPAQASPQRRIFEALAASGQDPMAAYGVAQSMAPKPADPLTINNRLVDPRTGQVLGDYSDPQKPMAVNNRLVDPQTGQVLGDYSDPAKPEQSDYVPTTLADGVYFVNKNNPNDKVRLGPAPKKDGEGPFDPNAPLDPERIRLEREFSKDWKTIETDWGKIDGDYQRIKAMGRQASSDPERASAADLALIVGFTKMQDPGSVAREGEVALTQQTVGVLDQANNLLNQWQNGKTVLPTDARVNILRAAEELHRVYSDAYRKRGEEYATAAQQYQYPVSRVMMGYNPSAPQQAPTLQSAAGDLVKDTPPGFAWMTKGFGAQPAPPAQDDISDLLKKYGQ